MSSIFVYKELDIIPLWRAMYGGDLEEIVIPYECHLRTNREPGEFTIIHPKEITLYARNPNNIYLLLRPYTSACNLIDRQYMSFIVVPDRTRITLYQATMPSDMWIKLIEHIGSDDLLPLRAIYEEHLEEAELIREKLNANLTR